MKTPYWEREILLSAFIVITIGLYTLSPSITGFATHAPVISDTINLVATTSANYTWAPEEEGLLTRLSINGKIQGNGAAKVYLLHQGKSYIVFDSSLENSTSRSNEFETTLPDTENRTISLMLEYNKNTFFDTDDDGFEELNGVVDITVKNTKFSWVPNSTKLCTRWRIFSEDERTLNYVCYGSVSCCASLNLERNGEWDFPYYSAKNKDGATQNNIVSAQIIYYDNTSQRAKTGNVYSDWKNLPVRFSSTQKFFAKECVDTCSLPALNGKNYTLFIELIGGAMVKIDSLDYNMLISQ